jgi:hypothetical protein
MGYPGFFCNTCLGRQPVEFSGFKDVQHLGGLLVLGVGQFLETKLQKSPLFGRDLQELKVAVAHLWCFMCFIS